MRGPVPYGRLPQISRADERRFLEEVIYAARRQRRAQEVATREKQRRAEIELQEFLIANRRRRRVAESERWHQRYVRSLVVGLENSIGAGRYV